MPLSEIITYGNTGFAMWVAYYLITTQSKLLKEIKDVLSEIKEKIKK